MYGKGDQTYAALRIEFSDRFHQADITFLNQVGLRQSVTGIPTRNTYYQTHMGKNQLLGCFQIVIFLQTSRQRKFILCTQHREGLHQANVLVQSIGRADCR